MDQLKKQLAVVLQYGFWIGSAIVLIGSVAVWYMASSELSQQADRQIGSIESNVQKVKNLRDSMSDQPNAKSHARMEELISAREDEVLRAWSSIYQDQRRILTWPKTKELREDFIDEFRHPKDPETGIIDKSRQKLPYEKYVKYPVPDEQKVPQFILRNYERYIGKVMPDIAKIAKTEWTADFDIKSEGASAAGMMESEDTYGGAGPRVQVDITGQKEGPLVQWSQQSQQAVLSDLFPWRGRRPTTLEVYYSQENLWILKQLLEIVSEVNGNARQPFEAKIREIKELGIGKSVQFGAGSIASPGVAGSMMGPGMDGESMYEMSSGGADMGGEMGMSFGSQEAVDPADNRYVNTELKPITGSQLRGALESNSPNDAALAVAKRVPVMMTLHIDQRYLPQLLAECGSAPLMVDVRQVRVLDKGKSSTTSMGMESSGMGEMGEGEEDTDMGYGGAAAAAPSKKKDEFPFDMTVEVYGVIYFYNPPNREALGVDQVTDDTEVDGTKIGEAAGTSTEAALPPPTAGTPATPPAATPPAAGTPATPPAATPPAAGTPATPPAAGTPATPPAAGTPATPPAADTTPPDAATPAANTSGPTPPVAINSLPLSQ